MASTSENQEQQHPLYHRDRALVNTLLAATATDYNLVELARLRIRYRNFPGARDIQADLEQVMQSWELTETALHEKTRQIYANGGVYKSKANKGEEDWS